MFANSSTSFFYVHVPHTHAPILHILEHVTLNYFRTTESLYKFISFLNTSLIAPNKPPSIICPTVPGQIADKLEDTVIVTWTEPTATDPEGQTVE